MSCLLEADPWFISWAHPNTSAGTSLDPSVCDGGSVEVFVSHFVILSLEGCASSKEIDKYSGSESILDPSMLWIMEGEGNRRRGLEMMDVSRTPESNG